MKRKVEVGKIETLAWFKEQVKIKNGELVKERILYPYRKELEKFVRYPSGKREPWKFHKNLTTQWIEKNFDKIAGRKKDSEKKALRVQKMAI
ncbi:uncharacterized protein DUF771 [Trichococcus patagoniensis]|uniref:Uncharacterized protein DUF771 n=2 Tax=Trichococcus patagoniensis TaxID=382641 RepID=A0A2T5IRA6_9LACT|nr:uncharacterized protein DUF771 [Trichococcus patagoniensis]